MRWMNKLFLKGNNRGAALIAVLVAMIFVSVLGTVVMSVTITNIHMKEMDQSGKKNFYSSEELMNELTLNLNDKAAVAMQKAYTSMLEEYITVSKNSAEEIQEIYSRKYLENLTAIFWDQVNASRHDQRAQVDKTLDENNEQKLVFVVACYQTDIIKDCLPAEYRDCVQIDDGLSPSETNAGEYDYDMNKDQALFVCDYINGRFTLQNVRLVFDEQGYESIITTDIVFNTPVLNFSGSNLDKEYMGYALIADNAIDVSASNVQIMGNAYAGAGGIYTSGGNWGTLPSKFKGDLVVTRGDIVANGGQSLVLGDDTNSTTKRTQIWAENLVTEGSGVLKLYGNSYISDDLTLNGENSKVEVHGNYYGYNFQKNYDSANIETSNAAYSSAIIVNAKGATLDLTDASSLLLAGRTFISRGVKGNSTNSQDIMLGESASIRTNQLAYSVSEKYLSDIFDKNGNVIGKEMTADNVSSLQAKLQINNLDSYLNQANRVTAYYYMDKATMGAEGYTPEARYYLNFASPQKANDFFAVCYAQNMDTMDTNADNYAGNMAIRLDEDNTLLTLAGDIMYKDKDDAVDAAYTVKSVTMDGRWEKDGSVFNAAAAYAIKYKSLQMYLEETHNGLSVKEARVTDKTEDTLFEYLISKDGIETYKKKFEQSSDAKISDSKKTYIRVVNSSGENGKNKRVIVYTEEKDYTIPDEYTEGIIVAKGNVQVNKEFEGMIIADGTISFSVNATVTSNRLMVAGMLEAEKNSGREANISILFNDYNQLKDDVIGTVALDHYVTYDNWVKSGE